LTEKQRLTAFARVDFLQLYEASTEGKTYRKFRGCKEEFLSAFNTGLLAEKLFEQLGEVTYGTAQRWLSFYEQSGRTWEALAPAHNSKTEAEKSFGLTKIEQGLFLEIWLSPEKRSVAKSYQITKFMLEKKGLSTTRTEMTFRRFAENYKRVHLQEYTLIREGEKALKDKVHPYLSRKPEELEVGDVFIADGKTTTFDVINPFTGRPQKVTLMAYLDWRSCDIAGYEIMLTESTQSVTSALRMGILRLGKMPVIAYQDNGRAFKNRFFKGVKDFKEVGWTGLFAQLGIIPVYTMLYNSRAKFIESRWKEVVNGYEKLLQSFTGVSPVDKPAYMNRNEKWHKKLRSGRNGVSTYKIPTLVEAKELFETWLEFYRSRPCPYMPGKTIGEAFNEGRGPGVDKTSLDLLMMNWGDKPVRVHQNGVDALNGVYYDEALTGRLGEYVLVKYSLFDLSEVVVMDAKGRFICRAARREKVHPIAMHLGSPKDQEELKLQLKQQRRLTAEAKRKTEQLLGYLPEREWLGISQRSEVIGQLANVETEFRPTNAESGDELIVWESDKDN